MALVSSISKVLDRLNLRSRVEVTSSDKSREKIRIAFPRLEVKDLKNTTRFSLIAKLDLSLKLSMLSGVKSELQRRSFSVLLLVTAVCLFGPPALAMEVHDIPQYGPQLPKKDIDFKGEVFLARVQRPVSVTTAYESQGMFFEEKLEQNFEAQEEGEFEFEEVLEISVVVPMSEFTAFNVFINLPEANERTSITLPEFVGSYASGEVDKPGTRRVKVRFGIGDKIRMLKLEKEPSILVAMVRNGVAKDAKITVKDIDIELE